MSLLVIKNGLLDTIQDRGRYGYQHLGINPGGAMDITAMQVANALVGNNIDEPVIEMHFPAAEIQFEETVLIALAGADFSATVNENQVPVLCPLIVPENSILRFNQQTKGARVYLSVQGGIVADEWLQSSSTHLKVTSGGYQGRALQKNDRLLLKDNKFQTAETITTCKILPWKANTKDLYREHTFRFIAAAEYDLLVEQSKQKLLTTAFTINRQSDRMGDRLQGETLQISSHREMISTAVTRGTIQLLPDGQLIILMADHQTTGGYPRIGHIISADFASLAQLQPDEKFFLQQTTLADAEKQLLDQQMILQQLQNACNFRLQDYLTRKWKSKNKTK